MNKIESALSRTTDTKALVLGEDAIPQAAQMFKNLFPGQRALVVADTNTFKVAGRQTEKLFSEAGIPQETPFVFTDPALYA